MTNEITTTNERFPTESALEQINSLVAKLAESKALPLWCDNPGKLLMTVLAGREIGMGPMEALRSFCLINGNFTLYGAAVITQLKRHGYKIAWGECTEKKATVTLTSPDGDTHTETYSIEEATKAGLTTDPKKDIWRRYPGRMCRWKAVGQATRFFCPEVLNGSYIREEMDGDGTVRAEPPEPTVAEITDDSKDDGHIESSEEADSKS